MRQFIVTKEPIGLDGAKEVVGVFTSLVRAQAACVGASVYDIFGVMPDRAYKSGTLLDVRRVIVETAKTAGT